jgi:hypothetical protein
MPCPNCNRSAGPDDPPDVSCLGFTPASGGERLPDVPDNEAERYIRCPKCGQMHDAQSLDAVLAHEGRLPHRIEVRH